MCFLTVSTINLSKVVRSGPKMVDEVVRSGNDEEVRSGPKWSEVVRSGLKWSEVVRSGPKLPEVVKNEERSGPKMVDEEVRSGSKWSDVVRSGLTWFEGV